MENLYKKIVNTVPVFFFLWSRDKKETVFLSERFYDEKSKDYYAPKEPREDLRQYIHPHSQPEYDRFFDNLSEENDYTDKVEIRAGDSLPDIKWLKINTFPVFNQGKEVEYIAGHISDATNSYEHSQFLQKQVESLDTVTFMLAHELASPIANIMGLSELLKSKAAKAEANQHLHLYDSIYNFGGEILTLAQGLVNLLDLQSSKEEFASEEIRLKDLIKQRIDNFYLKPNTKKISISYSDIDEEATVCLQPIYFAKAVEELLVYLIKYIESNSRIAISTPTPNDSNQTLIRISSSGAHLPKKAVQRVLDRSSKLGMLDVKGHKVRGMLELIIAKEICELHHGKLELVNDGAQSGFVISLPKRQAS